MPNETTNEQEQSATVIDQSVQDNELRTEAELEAAFEQMQAQEKTAQTSEKETQIDQTNDQDGQEEQEIQDGPPENTDDATSDNDELKNKAPNRVRLSELNERDRAIVANAVQLVRDGLASSISEAVAILSGGQQPASENVSDKAEDKEELDEFDTQIAEQTQEIEAIEQALAKARADFDEDMVSQLTKSLLNAYAQKIKLETKKEIFAEQKRAQEELEARQQQLSEYETEYQRYRDLANELYPDGAKPGTPMFEEIRRVVAWFEQNNPEIFQTPNYPLAVAGFAAANLAKSGKQANGSAAAKRNPISQTGRARGPARPTDVLVGDDATSAATNAQNVLAQLDGITNEQDLERLAEAVFAGS